MTKIPFIILLITLGISQQVDELEGLINHIDNVLLHPEELFKNEGIWYSTYTNEPFTGRVKIFSNNVKKYKIAECTIFRGKLNGYFTQYFSSIEQIPGIIGLYSDGKKEGNWIWIEPLNNWQYQFRNNLDERIITSIDFSADNKDGLVLVYVVDDRKYDSIQPSLYNKRNLYLKGQYSNNEKIGEWYFYDNIHSDYDLLSIPYELIETLPYWTRKISYFANESINNECREPYRDIDCASYKKKYQNKIYSFVSPEKFDVEPKFPMETEEKFFIVDDLGVNVEIDIKTFYKHINTYHNNKVSVHKQGGHSFTINDQLRGKIKSHFINLN